MARAARTRLNGQSQPDDILIDVRRNWFRCSVEDKRLPFIEPSWDDPRAYQWAFAAKFKILTGPSDGMIAYRSLTAEIVWRSFVL
jgi:hypothetical protein